MGIFDREEDKGKTDGEIALRYSGEIAGGLLGGAAGAGVSNLMDRRLEGKRVAEALASTNDKKVTRDQWRELLRLFEGKMTLDDFPPGEREKMKELLQTHNDQLRQMSRKPGMRAESFRDLNRGHVIDLGKGKKRVKQSMFAMDKGNLARFQDKVTQSKHPHGWVAPIGLGLVGSAAASRAIHKYQTRNQEEDPN